MHILFVPSWYPSPANSATGSFFREQAQMLQRAGDQVGVLAVTASNVENLRWLNKPAFFNEQGITVSRQEVPSFPSYLHGIENAALKAIARRSGTKYARLNGVPDVIHAHSAFPALIVAAALADLWNRPIVFTEHRPSSLSAPAGTYRQKSIRKAVRAADAVVGVSDAFSKALADHYKNGPWTTLRLPVPDVFFSTKMSSRSSDFRFCHVSHIDENKRVELTCRAFKRSFPSGGATLTIVGGTETVIEEVRASLTREGTDLQGISFVGSRSRQETAQIMADSDCFVLVSEVEAGGTVFSEAQASGLRIVASKTWAGLSAVREDLGLLVTVDDEAELAEAMLAVCEDSRFLSREEIRSRARDLYSEEAFVEASRKVYEKAMQKRICA